GGIAGGWADAAVFFVDEIVAGEIFGAAVAPVGTSLPVKKFGEGFGQSVGEGLGHDRVVVVVIAVELFGEFVAAEAGGDGEGAEIVLATGVGGGDEVGQGEEIGLAFALPLLAEEVEAGEFVGARLVGVESDVAVEGGGGPEAIDAAGGEEFFVDDFIEEAA